MLSCQLLTGLALHGTSFAHMQHQGLKTDVMYNANNHLIQIGFLTVRRPSLQPEADDSQFHPQEASTGKHTKEDLQTDVQVIEHRLHPV